MLNTIALRWGRWPKVLQRSVAGLAVMLLLTLSYLMTAGVPQPLPPANALFAPVSAQTALVGSRPELSSFDFSVRPVFALKRMPAVPPVIDDGQDVSTDEIAVEEAVVSSIEGVALLGIFGSGEVAGVIIRLDESGRQRLLIGESVEGWTLRSLESRRAILQAASGQQAILEMAFATDQELLHAAEPTSRSQSARSDSQQNNATTLVLEKASEVTAEEQSTPRRITFENYYGGPPTGVEGKK